MAIARVMQRYWSTVAKSLIQAPTLEMDASTVKPEGILGRSFARGDIRHRRLWQAHALAGVRMSHAKLQGANLCGASLVGAWLDGAKGSPIFDGATRLARVGVSDATDFGSALLGAVAAQALPLELPRTLNGAQQEELRACFEYFANDESTPKRIRQQIHDFADILILYLGLDEGHSPMTASNIAKALDVSRETFFAALPRAMSAAKLGVEMERALTSDWDRLEAASFTGQVSPKARFPSGLGIPQDQRRGFARHKEHRGGKAGAT